jgi:Ca2+-transporting ATPase
MTAADVAPRPAWHTLTPEEALRELDSDPAGLQDEDAEQRLERYGPNRLAPIEPVSTWRILVDQFASLVVLLLLAAAAVALALGDALEAIAIGAVLLINTAIGFAVELRARRAMDALLSSEVPTARVLRAGRVASLSADRLVPGDLVQIEDGDMVPADARVVTSSELQVDEAPLTGESFPVDKDPARLADPDTVLAERTPMLYAGTAVTHGRASAVVVHTGRETEVGRIGTLVSQVEEGKTPLEVRLDALGRRLVWFTLVIAAVIIVLGILRGAPVGLMIETGLALAIAAVPEGLPAVATIALAVGLRRMARRHALVRRLAAVETLGATTVVCTDKTGTLTAGRMAVTAVANADHSADFADGAFSWRDPEVPGSVDVASHAWLRRLLEACALTSRAHVEAAEGDHVGDPTDVALALLARDGGVDPDELSRARPEVDEIPFAGRTRFSASIHRAGEERVIHVKGAPEAVLERSSTWATASGELPLDDDARVRFARRNDELAARGLRVIALASGRGTDPEHLTALGLVGIVDPPAPGVEETIRTLRGAGIRTVMLTGDQSATAVAVAQELGTARPEDEAMTGRALTALTDDDLAGRIDHIGVFSRVSPEQKLRIVTALQARGELVAMIGDGINDAAALKKADIGVAMGVRGTDAAKQTASIVLGDDRLATIGAAVEEGRVIYENIRKFVYYLFSCNVAEVLVLLSASLAGTPIPLPPLQILWLNLVTDTFPALALALEPAEPGVMARAPLDPDRAILSRGFVISMGVYAALITAVTMAGFLWGLRGDDPGRATTIAFMTLALAQLFHLGNARSRGPVLRRSRAFANRWAVAAIPLVMGLQLAAVHWPPLADLLGTTPLARSDWLAVMGLSLVPAVIGQLVRVFRGPRDQP